MRTISKPFIAICAFIVLSIAVVTAVLFGGAQGRKSVRIESYSIIETGGGGYPQMAFHGINDELKVELSKIIASHDNVLSSHNHLVVVSPQMSGFSVHMVAPSGSPMWTDENQSALGDWISKRMGELTKEWHDLAEQETE